MPERIHPSPQEENLIRLQERDYDTVAEQLASDLQEKGRSPSLLAIARPDLAIDLAETWYRQNPDTATTASADSLKSELYHDTYERAVNGDPEAIGILFKTATSLGQVSAAACVLLDNKDTVAELRTNRKYVQYIGSFNPQHIGHRTTVQSTLATAGEASEVVMQIVDRHPIKQDLPPYGPRFSSAEEKLIASTIIENERVTVLDVPAGNGLARDGAAQIELIADTVGDEEMRWLVGSDKFMSDVNSMRSGKLTSRAATRFRNPRTHLYVARRVDHSQEELSGAVDYITDAFGTSITEVPEAPSTAVLDAAASKIRAMRHEGHHQEADAMESSDLRHY